MNKIKVLHFHGGMKMGGTESVIMNLYRNIDRDKFDFDFTTTFKDKCDYDEEIENLGGEIYYIPSKQDVGYIKHIKGIIKILKKEKKYDVVHTHMNFHGGIVAVIAKFLKIKKVICHAHNTQDDASGVKRFIEIKILRTLMLIFADELIACGEEAGKFVFGEKNNFTLLNNSVDLNRFSPITTLENQKEIKDIKDKYGINKKLILGHVGRFSKQKNHDFIIKIMENLKEKDIDFKFIFIGDGELKEEFIRKIEEKDLKDVVIFLGLVKNPEIWLKIFDKLIFPSLYEGLPVTLIEAQATGLVSIISKNISPNVDMNLGLINFLDINENYDEWVNIILNGKNIKLNNSQEIENKMNDKGYSLEKNINMITNLYSKEV